MTKEIVKEKRSDKVVLCTYKYKYNNKGQLTRVQGGLGRKLSTHKYDTNGNLTSIEGKGRIHSMKNIYDDKWLTF